MRSSKRVAGKILRALLMDGSIKVADSASGFLPGAATQLAQDFRLRSKDQCNKTRIYKSMYGLKERELVRVKKVNTRYRIYLTEKGKKLALRYGINGLKIKKPSKWDRRWRVLIFDIKEKNKAKREYLRIKLKSLGLYRLQKSTWIYPYSFGKEMEALRLFLRLSRSEVRMIVALKIENDAPLKKHFRLRRL